VETLRFWGHQFPNRKPGDYLFPRERYATAGSEGSFGFQSVIVYESDPSKPIGNVKEAWEAARKRAGLPGVRIHDLRHTAVSRMIAGGIPLSVIRDIVGWSDGTLAKMIARYGHSTLAQKRARGRVHQAGRPKFPQGTQKIHQYRRIGNRTSPVSLFIFMELAEGFEPPTL